jgi:hypothetical protein
MYTSVLTLSEFPATSCAKNLSVAETEMAIDPVYCVELVVGVVPSVV